MKQATEIKAVHIVSQPGGFTRYDYLVYRNQDIYSFAPINSTFAFPQKIRLCEVDTEEILGYEINEDKPTTIKLDGCVMRIASQEKCNPHTVLECMRTIINIEEGLI